MGTLSLPSQFKIDYPYYGLFRSANVKVVEAEGDLLYECNMIHGGVVWLKKTNTSSRWLDLNSGSETPLARLLGTYIDDHMRVVK